MPIVYGNLFLVVEKSWKIIVEKEWSPWILACTNFMSAWCCVKPTVFKELISFIQQPHVKALVIFFGGVQLSRARVVLTAPVWSISAFPSIPAKCQFSLPNMKPIFTIGSNKVNPLSLYSSVMPACKVRLLEYYCSFCCLSFFKPPLICIDLSGNWPWVEVMGLTAGW